MNHFEVGFLLLRLVVLLFILVLLLKKYIETHFKTLNFLIISICSFILLEGFSLFYILTAIETQGYELGLGTIQGLFYLFIILFATTITYYMILLFLEAFEAETILTEKNLTLGGIVLVVSLGYILTSIFASLAVIDEIENRFVEEFDYISLTGIWIGWLIFFLLSFILILVLIARIYRSISKKMKQISRDESLRILSYLRITILLLFLGAIFPFGISILDLDLSMGWSALLSVTGLSLFVVLYLRSGIYLFGDETLRRLIFVNYQGIAIYGYIFQFYIETKFRHSNPIDQEILFTGALKAINSLLEEFTGLDDDLVELKMKNTSIIVERISEKLSALLITSNPTLSDRETLKSLTQKVNNELDELPETNITYEQVEQLNRIVESLFGKGEGSSFDRES